MVVKAYRDGIIPLSPRWMKCSWVLGNCVGKYLGFGGIIEVHPMSSRNFYDLPRSIRFSSRNLPPPQKKATELAEEPPPVGSKSNKIKYQHLFGARGSEVG